jgi:GNAT superfamily N-acetyltransferase
VETLSPLVSGHHSLYLSRTTIDYSNMTSNTDPLGALAANLEFQAITGPDFELAMSGFRDDAGARVPRWLHSPQLKYYYHRSCLQRGEDTRLYFLCLQPAAAVAEEGNEILRRVVGMLELETSPYDPGEVWFKFITVDPAHQRQGIARKLLDMMVAHLHTSRQRLIRSSASDEGAQKIMGYIDHLLATNAIAWTQSGRS